MIRNPAVAGMFYPEDPVALRNFIEKSLAKVPCDDSRKLRALIVPHAGYAYSGCVAASAYALLGKRSFRRAVLLGPSHKVCLDGIATDGNDFWKTPLGSIAVRGSDFPESSQAHFSEHCLEVQVPFLQVVVPDCAILPLLVGVCDPVDAISQIEPLLDDDTILIISSDLSHYHDYETANNLDASTNNAILGLDIEKMFSDGEACGKQSIMLLLELAKSHGWYSELVQYSNSGDTAGSKSSVVGYASFAFYSG